MSSPSPNLPATPDQPAFRKPRADLYTVLLIVALLAIILGCLCLYFEIPPQEYPEKPPFKGVPAVSSWAPPMNPSVLSMV